MDDEKRLDFGIKFIVKRLVTWPRYRKSMDEGTASSIANEIINHLKLSNRRFRKGPPTPPHLTPGGAREP